MHATVSPLAPLLLVLALAVIGWVAARARARMFRRGTAVRRLPALPQYHAWFVALWAGLPAALFALAWPRLSHGPVLMRVLQDPAARALPGPGPGPGPGSDILREAILAEAGALATGRATGAFHPLAHQLVPAFRDALQFYGLLGAAITVAIAMAGGIWAFLRLRPDFTARNQVERIVMTALLGASLAAVLTTFGIFASLLVETLRFFELVPPWQFLFGTHWAPDPMADIAGGTGQSYGALPLFWGTFYIGVVIAMLVAIPLGLMSAIYLAEYASARLRRWVKPMLEVLAGIPTVVYGYFAALTVAPAVRHLGQALGLANPSSESALAAGLVMGVMIIPFVSSMADDAIAAVPQDIRDGSLAMGATRYETVRQVLVPAALPGIVAGIMLAISRAIGETMIVVMAAGATARLTANPFEAMTTVTFQIVAMLTGEGSFDHPATLSAFALGMVLFLVTLALNFVALRVVKRFREAYD